MKNEKLVEATMLALRGKLLEEVDRNFEKVLDYINGDYHRVEDFTDLEVCYPNEEDTDWLDAYDVANELLNKLSKEDWATMAKEIDDGTLRDKLTDWGMKAGSLEEARKEYDDKAHQIYQDMKDKQNKKTESVEDLDINSDKVYKKVQVTFECGDCGHKEKWLFDDMTERELAELDASDSNDLVGDCPKCDSMMYYMSNFKIIKENKERERIAKRKTETKNDLMSFEDWVDYIDIKKEYPEWFKDKQELDRPFLDVINDHMDELNRDYRKYKRSQSKKKTESNKLTDWGMKVGSLEEARSHKDDNEKVAPRRQHSPYQREYGRVYGDLKDVPKRARFSANKGKASDWGYYDLNELDTYNKSTDDIEDYKRYKTDAESERALARYHNANAQQNDDRASDIVRDKKLDRAKRNLKGQEIFDVEESKKVESEEDAINVMNSFRDKNALYGYVVSYLENNAPNNEEILKLCKEILAKGAINVCGKDKINDFYNKCKSDIEARINALGENYIKTILAQYVFEDVIYGLEDNLESAIQK